MDDNGHLIRTTGIAADAAEHSHAAVSLAASEERFRSLFETMAQGVVYQDAQGEIVAANPAAQRILGLSLDQMQGRTSSDPRWRTLHEDGSPFPGDTHPAMTALRTGRPVHDVVMGVFVPAADQYRWLSVNAVPLFAPGSPAPYQVYTTFDDITERIQGEALLYAQRDLARCIGAVATVERGFCAILEIMLRLTGMDSGGIYLFSPDAQRLDLVYHQGLGAEFIADVGSYLKESPNVQVVLTGKPFYFPHGHPVTQSPTYLAEQLRSAATLPILYQDRVIGCANLSSHTQDEVRQFARHALEPLAVEVGNFVVHLQAQAALRASEEKFRQLADTIDEVFWIFDNREERLVYLNPAYEKIWGISIADTYRESRKYIESIHPDDRPILFAALERQAQGEQTEMEYRIVRPDDTVRWIFDRSFPILGVDGRVQRTAGVATDITPLLQSQQELQELNRSLEARVAQRTAELARALRIKDEFLANMSHELRTPLHGILAMTETLLDQVRGPLNERQQKSVGLIDDSGRHLLALINDLLDLSKIEAGKLELHFSPVSVDDVCRISLLFVREMAVKKQIRVDYAHETPGVQITADEQRIKQMLVNLLGNAVKFTPSGGHVCLRVTVTSGGEGDLDAGLISFAVEDDGPGIAPADQAALFQPFSQLDSQLTRRQEGTGLGLALVKRLAEQHGGTLRLASTGIPGEGCCFTVTLPTHPAAQK